MFCIQKGVGYIFSTSVSDDSETYMKLTDSYNDT